MKRLFIVLASMMLIASCKKDVSINVPIAERGVLTVNEGNFNWGNAGLSLFDSDKNTLSKDVFKEANGFSLGDVAQSATLIDSLLFVVVNNSARVVVVSASTFKQQSVIAIAGSSPRFFLSVNDSIAYVTELYANKIWIVNIKTGATIGHIQVDGETNQIEKVNNQVFVAERTKFNGATVAQIRVINALSHQTTKIIPLPTQPNSICKDMAGNIWALTDTGGGKPASLIAIDNSTLMVTKQFDFPTGKTPNRLRYNASTHSLCYLSGADVYSAVTTLTVLPTSSLFTTTASIPYAFDIDTKGKYYLADAIDYTQSSKCFIYNADGKQSASFNAGINTNQFVFLP
jgi:hypothetical protein